MAVNEVLQNEEGLLLVTMSYVEAPNTGWNCIDCIGLKWRKQGLYAIGANRDRAPR